MADLKLINVNKIYNGTVHAVHDINIDIKDGEFYVLVGPSGCGKSTTLRMIAGLESITTGDMLIDGERVNSLAPVDRDIAMVFQNYALYPNMTVYDNMGISLKVRHESKQVIQKYVEDAAGIIGLTEYLNRLPANLSGGQRQRVALGRTVVRNPKVFLMDEPLSNLDAKLREKTRIEIVKLQKRLHATTVYVTHDQIEAMTMADKIVVMSMGYIQQIGTPYEVYNQPKNLFVAGFIGTPNMNFIEGTVDKSSFVFGQYRIELTEEQAELLKNYQGKEVILGIRPEHISASLSDLKKYSGSVLELAVDSKEFLGKEYYVRLVCNDQLLTARIERRTKIEETLKIALASDKMHFFDKQTTNVITKEGSEQ